MRAPRFRLALFTVVATSVAALSACPGVSPSDGGTVDGGGGGDALCDEAPPGVAYQHEIFRFVAETPSVELVITRDYVDGGVGESAIYALSRASLTIDGETACVTDKGALDYENSHHNWYDTAFFDVGETHYTFSLVYALSDVSQGWVYTLTGTNAADDVTFGPLTLTPVEGPIQYMIDIQ